MKEDINENIEKIDRAMSQEGMPLTDEDKNNLKDVMTGKKTYEQKIKTIIKNTLESNEVKGVKKR